MTKCKNFEESSSKAKLKAVNFLEKTEDIYISINGMDEQSDVHKD